MEPVMDGVTIAVVAIILGFVAVGAGMVFLKWWKNFCNELEDIKYEINTSKGMNISYNFLFQILLIPSMCIFPLMM